MKYLYLFFAGVREGFVQEARKRAVLLWFTCVILALMVLYRR